MLKIKFSHHYYKLAHAAGRKATLIAAIPYRIDENTPESFIRNDTAYATGYYDLKPGDYVLLLFLGEYGLFTTIRPRKGRYGDKLEYYSKHINEEFEIVIKEEGNGND